MPTDFFGYERQRPGQVIFSSDYAMVMFANSLTGDPANKLGLVQAAGVSYQHNVQPRFETGSHELFWLTGQSLGAVQLTRLVGEQGILVGIPQLADPNDLRKGALGTVDIKMGRKGISGIAVSQSVLELSGCMMSNYGTSFSVGGLEVQESVTIQVAMMRKVNT